MKTEIRLFLMGFMLVALASCASQDSRILQGGDSLKLRSMQTRSFDTSNKNSVVRSTIATLQDLGFVIDKADADLGTISATKLSGYQIRMTVTVRPKPTGQMIVRANAQYNVVAIEDPKMYQDFFTSLGKSLFLSANSVE